MEDCQKLGDRPEIEIDEEGMKNLVGLFSLLIKIDRRNNPELYKKTYD